MEAGKERDEVRNWFSSNPPDAGCPRSRAL